ncbi:BON domain-containing protein [Ohtaekwangia sp.]|uniref:BON domain-containing protein n=1 Tax=Ohtaekwangia sp. TaxID=2066019 RepID=UPI002FDCCD30
MINDRRINKRRHYTPWNARQEYDHRYDNNDAHNSNRPGHSRDNDMQRSRHNEPRRNQLNEPTYDRDFNTNYYGSERTWRGGSYEGGYGNRGYNTDSGHWHEQHDADHNRGYGERYSGQYSQHEPYGKYTSIYNTWGPHRGKGPKGYKRSDERIREDVSDRLTIDPHIDATDIEVTVTNGDVLLTGTVEDRYAKRHAEDIIAYISGVQNIENRIRVVSR